MKKVYLSSLLLILCLTLSACGKTPVQKVEKGKKLDLLPKVELSLLEWADSGLTLECRIDAPENEIILRTKNSKIRIEGIVYPFSENESQYGYRGIYVIDRDTVYMWRDDEGVKMDLYVYDELNRQSTPDQKIEDGTWRNIVKIWETGAFPYECREANLADDYFLPDPEVVFSNITEEILDPLVENEEDNL